MMCSEPMTFYANESEQFLGESIVCADGANCTVICEGFRACAYDATIQCPYDAQCNIICSGDSSCRDSHIVCPSNFPCNIACGPNNIACAEVEHIP